MRTWYNIERFSKDELAKFLQVAHEHYARITYLNVSDDYHSKSGNRDVSQFPLFIEHLVRSDFIVPRLIHEQFAETETDEFEIYVLFNFNGKWREDRQMARIVIKIDPDNAKKLIDAFKICRY